MTSRKTRWFCNRPLSPIMEISKQNEEDEYIVPSSSPLWNDNLYIGSDDDSVKDPDFIPETDESSDVSLVRINTEVKQKDETKIERESNALFTSVLIGAELVHQENKDECVRQENKDEHKRQEKKERVHQKNADERVHQVHKDLQLDKVQFTIDTKIKGDCTLRKGEKGKHYCYFCEDLVLNFARHIFRNHRGEAEVQKNMILPTNSKERREQLSLIRNRGNYLNQNENKPVRTPIYRKVIPCPECFGYFSERLLWRHRKNVHHSKSINHKTDSHNVLLKDLRIDKNLKEQVFPRMRGDDISLTAKKDSLICAFGARYIQVHREKHFVNVASRKMRELAKLLLEIKKINPQIKSLFEVLQPVNFDVIIQCAKVVAKYDWERQMYKSPTYAMNIGTSLKQCCEIGIYYALRKKNVFGTVSGATAEANLKNVIMLIDSQWKFEVSSQANNDLNLQKWNKITIVPLASDLKILKEYLVTEGNSADTKLKEGKNRKDYIMLTEIIFCKLMLLNRRRPGELQRFPLHVYTNSNGHNYEEFSETCVNPCEHIIMKSFKRVVIRGKRGRGVPVLFSPDVQNQITTLLDYRAEFIVKENPYLFASISSTEPICGYKTLKKHAEKSGTKNPSTITSTRLRKHLATLSQLFSMTSNDVEALATFMGHTVGVHKGSYRLPDDVYQISKISKLLLLMEKGEASKFKGKTLNEIDLDLEENLLETCQIEDEDEEEIDFTEVNSTVPLNITEQSVSNVDTLEPKKKKRVLIPWTDEQKQVVKTYFAKHIQKKIPPKKMETMALIEQHCGLLENKDWLKIKVFVQNEYNKK